MPHRRVRVGLSSNVCSDRFDCTFYVGGINDEYLNQQADEEYLLQVRHDFKGLREENCRVISADFLDMKNGGVYHDGNKVVSELINLISNIKTIC